jgi:hypothetical protein
MRRSSGITRAFSGGQVSRGALQRRGFEFGTTSDNPHPLTRDDGGLGQSGSVRADHAVDREHNRPRRGAGFDNPEKDFGPACISDEDHIDARQAVRPQYPAGAGYTRQPDRSERASAARARAGSANEYWDARWYGDPSKRQGG